MVDEFDESGTISRTGVEDIFCAKIGKLFFFFLLIATTEFKGEGSLGT